jgi:hypothetical protein
MIPKPFSRAALAGILCYAAITAGGCGATGSGGRTADPTPEAPEHFVYGPFDVTYRIASHTFQEQEFGGQANTNDYAMHWYLSIVHQPPTLTLTLDSVPQITGTNPGLSTSDLDSSVGAEFSGTFTPNGAISGFTGGNESNAFLQQLSQSLERFLPRIPDGGAAAGQMWTDTLETTTRSGGLEIEIQLITESQAGSWVEHSGARSLEVSTVTSYSLSGGGNQMGSEIDLSGTGIRHGLIYLGSDGRFLGGSSADTANMTATVAAMGAIIPIFQTRHDTVSVAR